MTEQRTEQPQSTEGALPFDTEITIEVGQSDEVEARSGGNKVMAVFVEKITDELVNTFGSDLNEGKLDGLEGQRTIKVNLEESYDYPAGVPSIMPSEIHFILSMEDNKPSINLEAATPRSDDPQVAIYEGMTAVLMITKIDATFREKVGKASS